MLGLIGVLGALMAGVVGDALMSLAHKDDDDATPADGSEAPVVDGDLVAEAGRGPDADNPAPAFLDDDDDIGNHDPAEDAPLPQDGTSGVAMLGTDADEFILGTSDADWIAGVGGDDTIDGGADADTLFGGTGTDHLIGTDDDAADLLYGGDGDDKLHIGAADTAWGDGGDDAFTLSDYGPGDPPAVIADYTPGEDRIVLMYDADLHPEPIVHTEAIEGTEDVSVLLDGIQIAIVQGAAGLEWEDIELMAA